MTGYRRESLDLTNDGDTRVAISLVGAPAGTAGFVFSTIFKISLDGCLAPYILIIAEA
jgi:hypothetical protein